MNLRAALLGGGSWGTTVASLIARNAPVKLWARDKSTVDEINGQHTNSKYLPGARLNSKLVATGSIKKAVSKCDVLVMGGDASAVIWARLIFSILVVAVLVRLCRLLPDYVWNKYLVKMSD